MRPASPSTEPAGRSASEPFAAASWTLTTRTGGSVCLDPIDAASAGSLARAITDIDPWRRMGYGADAMAAYLAVPGPGACRRVIRSGDRALGAVAVRHPWLRGPYLELLALLPGCQGHGIGAAVLDWMEGEVAGRANSLWVCTSTFNVRAVAFYERHGFVRVGDLDGLVGPGFTEILLRKRL